MTAQMTFDFANTPTLRQRLATMLGFARQSPADPAAPPVSGKQDEWQPAGDAGDESLSEPDTWERAGELAEPDDAPEHYDLAATGLCIPAAAAATVTLRWHKKGAAWHLTAGSVKARKFATVSPVREGKLAGSWRAVVKIGPDKPAWTNVGTVPAAKKWIAAFYRDNCDGIAIA